MTRRYFFLVAGLLLTACNATPDAGGMPDDVAAATGLHFTYRNGSDGDYRVREIIGGGVALLDIDGDADLDVYLVQGDERHEKAAGDRLFINQLTESGQLKFTGASVTGSAADYGMGVAVADVDGDGDPDLLVTNEGADKLYRNDGGVLRAAPGNWGLDSRGWSTSATFCDYDRDGDLDLFIAGYLVMPPGPEPVCQQSGGYQDYCSPGAFAAAPDHLWRNDGDDASPRFVDVSEAAGVAGGAQPGLGVVCADLDADGWVDFYVANDRAPNHLWRNQHDGTFVETGLKDGAALNLSGVAEASMGIALSDYDDDGDEDLFVTHFDPETNTLYDNEGGGRFLDSTSRTGLGLASVGYTGWGTAWIDVDNDTDLDLFAANGGVLQQAARRGLSEWPYEQSNQLFINEAGRFSVRVLGGPPATSRGAAVGDIDNDGDLDIVVSNNSAAAQMLLNHAAPRARGLIVMPVDGRHVPVEHARVGLSLDGGATRWRRTHRDGSFLSASDVRVHFGVAGARTGLLSVQWPDGLLERWQLDALPVLLSPVRGTGNDTNAVSAISGAGGQPVARPASRRPE